ncbi:Rv3235 family protein [Streptomyces sp. YU58]|uniref:Rv3235 family protein n=1 Tax=Streptomyces sp. SX92 TaxID=3158972 RepID=UPI0027BA20E0|nr:Rv3235 family protein [Streptomyces coralus]WLW54585.1 Rv3235 family protein [Streptomyces coralus]
MTKVMTRANQHPGTRPPNRRDLRRPGGTPPRTPGGGPARTTAPGGRPPGSPGGGGRSSRTRPADSRPPTLTAVATPSASTAALSTPTVPAQASRRPTVPQPRPTDRFADLLLAVLSGRRPVHCMLRHTAGRAYDELAWLAERGPLRTTRGTVPVVRDIGYEVTRPGAIEAFARISAGDQLRAMAFRLEQGPDLRWRCTAVELGGPRRPHTDDD